MNKILNNTLKTLSFVSIVSSNLTFGVSYAQNIVPNNDGIGTQVNVNGNTFNIEGGKLSGNGQNLFHSFQEFGLSEGQIANFLSQPTIINILSRINGGNPSVINGLIQITNSNANLFLMNPAGIIFGKNASLNINGDFSATTATGIGFENGFFNNFGTVDYANLIGNPVSYQFDQTGGIIYNATDISLLEGKNLSLLGNSVINEGKLTANNGNILVNSVPGTGKLNVSFPNSLITWEISAPTDTTGNLENLTVENFLNAIRGNDNLGVTVVEETPPLLRGEGGIDITPENGKTTITGEINAVDSNVQILGKNIDILGDQIDITNENTEVKFKADNDLNVDSPIISNNPDATGGELTLQAGRNLNINADISTNNNLNLTANETVANGVIDAYRDAGNAEITLASGVKLDAGLGDVNINLSTGEGLTNNTAGNINLSNVEGENINIKREATNSGNINLINGEITANNGQINLNTIGKIDTTSGKLISNGTGVNLTATQEINTGKIDSNGAVFIRGGNSINTQNITTNGGTINMASQDNLPVNINTGILTTQGGSVNLSAGVGSITNKGINVSNGSILLIGNEVDLLGGDNSVSGNSITFLAGNNSQNIRVGDTLETDSNTLDLTTTDLNALQDGFSLILIGSANFQQVDKPLDLFILQDLSGSFDDDLESVKGLSQNLVNTIKSLQPDSKFGVGSFVDKPIAPFGSSGDYVYQTDLPLTNEGQQFINIINNLPIFSGDDYPEAQLEALFQVAKNTDEIGFRENAIRTIIINTDAEPHVAGDGIEAGITKPNNGDKIADLDEDYPSINQVSNALINANIQPIFAVTSDQIGTYQDLSNQLGRGQVVQLSSDSANLIEAIVVGLGTTNPGQGNITIVDNGIPLNIKDSLSMVTGGTITLENPTLNVAGNINLQGDTAINTIAGTINSTNLNSSINLSSNNIIPGNINSKDGSISLNGNINLQKDVTLNTLGENNLGGNITLRGEVNGPHNLTLDAGVNNINITSPMGNQQPLINLNANGNLAEIGGNITTIESQKLNSNILLNNDVTFTTDSDNNNTGSFLSRNITTNNNGYNLTIKAPESITTGYIDTSNSNDSGGIINLESKGFVRITEQIFDTNFSVSSAGLTDGDVTIKHGGNGKTPFIVGNPEVNGSLGIIGNNQSIINNGEYLYTTKVGNVAIVSVDERGPDFEGNPERTKNKPISNQPVDVAFTNTTPIQLKTLDETEEIIGSIQAATGEKPALIYVSFAPKNVALGSNFNQREAALTNEFEQHLNPNQKRTKPAISVEEQDSDILELIIVTKDETLRYEIEDATRDKVLELNSVLRKEISSQSSGDKRLLAASGQLYNWLIKPIEADLNRLEINNLVFVMDTGLRSLPLAALHDGNGYIIEKYSVGLMPSISLVDTTFVPLKDLKILGMGAETFTDQNPLPAVPTELNIITEQIWKGQSFLNQDFTVDKLIQNRQTNPVGILHLATHGEFNPGKPENSYIQFEDRRLNLSELRQLRLSNPAVELLVLSACKTALGDNEAELGFAGLAHQAGVKTALGSLWYVSDEGTLGLMSNFYQQLLTAPIKAEALREAQLAMLRGEVRLENGKLISGDRTFDIPESLKKLGNKDLKHPFFWSAFTMIGNPW